MTKKCLFKKEPKKNYEEVFKVAVKVYADREKPRKAMQKMLKACKENGFIYLDDIRRFIKWLNNPKNDRRFLKEVKKKRISDAMFWAYVWSGR